MATTAVRRYEIPFGPLKKQIWDVSIGAGDTEATWDTGLDNVVHASITTDSDQAFGKVSHNSSTGSDVAAGRLYIAGLANSSVLKVEVTGH